MAAVEKEDPDQVRAAQILVTLPYRELRRCPEWIPKQSGEASSSAATVATEVKRSSEASSAGTVAAAVMLSSEASSAGTVAAGASVWWRKRKRSGSRGETSQEPVQDHAAAATKGSGAPRSSEQERCAETPAASASAQQRPVVAAALCYAAVAAGSGTSTSAAPAKEPMKTPSPNTPLDYGAGGSGAPSSADDAAPAPAQAKRKGTGASARGSVGGDDEGCSPPAKRGPVAEEEKPMPISVQPSVQSETRASSGKGAPLPFDLNLLPCALDEDDDGCPDAT